MTWQDHFPLLVHINRLKEWKKKKKSDGVLQRLQAFILFKTTDSTNHAFDWTNLPGSGGGIISSVKWFSRRSTPELWNKTNQENHHFDFDQSAKAKLWISRDETPGANLDWGINHIIRIVSTVIFWYTMLIALKNVCPRFCDTVLKN